MRWFRQVLFTAGPAGIAVLLVRARPFLFHTRCSEWPDRCKISSVAWPDRISISLESGVADLASFISQNVAGGLACLLVLFFHWMRLNHEGVSPTQWVKEVFEDLLILAQVTLWNLAFLEIGRTVAQRPRPFVYSDPEGLGENVAHYTSFFSGHTSFVAAILMAALMIGVHRHVRRAWLIAVGSSWCLLTFLTGLLRVLAGRHFITDVLAGAVAGCVAAYVVFAFHYAGDRKGIPA